MSDYTMNVREVLAALCQIKREGPWEIGMGICGNVDGLLVDDDGYDLPGYAVWANHSKRAFESWDKFSGNYSFPVQDTHVPDCAKDQYLNYSEHGLLWSGVQGELRQDLLNHLIIYFTNLLGEVPE